LGIAWSEGEILRRIQDAYRELIVKIHPSPKFPAVRIDNLLRKIRLVELSPSKKSMQKQPSFPGRSAAPGRNPISKNLTGWASLNKTYGPKIRRPKYENSSFLRVQCSWAVARDRSLCITSIHLI
jgi:hypothetical protein